MAKFSKREYKRIAKRDHKRRKPKDPRPTTDMLDIDFEDVEWHDAPWDDNIDTPSPKKMPAFEKAMGLGSINE